MTMLMTELSGKAIYCPAQRSYAQGKIVVGNSVYSLGFVGGITRGLNMLTGGEIGRHHRAHTSRSFPASPAWFILWPGLVLVGSLES
jgi:hypothetical protein